MEDITFAGLIGVGVGALATIGTQGFLGWLDRHNGSRTAARLLYGDILEARDIMVAALREGSWATRRDFAHIDKAWRDRCPGIPRRRRRLQGDRVRPARPRGERRRARPGV